MPRFPTPHELWAVVYPENNHWRDKFAAVPYPDKSGSWALRFYQEIAVNRVLEALGSGTRRALLTLATGTGKTSIAFQIAWKIFSARWPLAGDGARRPRILFLADRNTLANQAFNDFNAFASFEEAALVRIKPDEIRKTGKPPTNGAMFFTIFQTFMSGPGDTPYFGEYPKDFFDLIIIDECHRGGANDEGEWRAILEYFSPAAQLGLTATPKRDKNTDTYAYFGEPLHTYSLKEGINDGFLTPFRVIQYSTTLDEYVHTADNLVMEGAVPVGRRFEEREFNRDIVIDEREEYRVKLWLNRINPDEKTLVFCAQQPHPLLVRDLINKHKKRSHPDYCVRVTADDSEIGEQFLRAFQDNEKVIPTILTTSQKLSTGVDARNVRNIVLMRPVTSMIEFKQIIGRGTRLYDGKDFFTIHDFVGAHRKFSDREWDGEPDPPTEPGTMRPGGSIGREEPRGGELVAPAHRPVKARVKLANGKERTIQSMFVLTYWHPDGTPVSAKHIPRTALRQTARTLRRRGGAALALERAGLALGAAHLAR